jgi:hypothetical protein
MWEKKLKGKTTVEAWRLIYDLTRPLTPEQRDRLWQYYLKVNKKPRPDDASWWGET